MSNFQPGTIVARVWDWLQTHEHKPYAWIAIADALDIQCSAPEMAMYLVSAIDLGVIRVKNIDQVMHIVLQEPPMRLPSTAPAAPTPQPVQAATSADAVKPRKRAARLQADESAIEPAVVLRPFVCAVFSDGRMLIEKGDTRIELTLAETKQLVHYMDRMAPEEVLG